MNIYPLSECLDDENWDEIRNPGEAELLNWIELISPPCLQLPKQSTEFIPILELSETSSQLLRHRCVPITILPRTAYNKDQDQNEKKFINTGTYQRRYIVKSTTGLPTSRITVHSEGF